MRNVMLKILSAIGILSAVITLSGVVSVSALTANNSVYTNPSGTYIYSSFNPSDLPSIEWTEANGGSILTTVHSGSDDWVVLGRVIGKSDNIYRYCTIGMEITRLTDPTSDKPGAQQTGGSDDIYCLTYSNPSGGDAERESVFLSGYPYGQKWNLEAEYSITKSENQLIYQVLPDVWYDTPTVYYDYDADIDGYYKADGSAKYNVAYQLIPISAIKEAVRQSAITRSRRVTDEKGEVVMSGNFQWVEEITNYINADNDYYVGIDSVITITSSKSRYDFQGAVTDYGKDTRYFAQNLNKSTYISAKTYRILNYTVWLKSPTLIFYHILE